jgi:hypothetical protein
MGEVKRRSASAARSAAAQGNTGQQSGRHATTIYCVVKIGTSWARMIGGGFHLPLSASDFGA